MIKTSSKLARKQLERRLSPLRKVEIAPPRTGWIRAIREALGMTTRQLARRLESTQSRIPAIEHAEVTGATTLKTLRQVAAAMDCTFVYAFVPIKPIDDILHDRAMLKARREVARIDHTMRLENQGVSSAELDAELRRIVEGLLAGPPKALWEDEPTVD
jgi:predicted DNA-binding mobile mystery protein A